MAPWIVIGVLAMLLTTGEVGLATGSKPAADLSLTPVRVECIRQAAREQSLPEEALWGILAAERGLVGQRLINPDGSLDHGPMQINSLWLPLLQNFGIDDAGLTMDGCLNVRAGAWILRRQYETSGGRIWEAIGRYHSATPRLKRRFIRRVWSRLTQMDAERLLHHINQRIGRWER